MRKPQIGDTVALESGLLFGERRRREGVVTALADDGMVTAEFPQPPHNPMTVTSDPEHFTIVRTDDLAAIDVMAAPAGLSLNCTDCGWVEYQDPGGPTLSTLVAHVRRHTAQCRAGRATANAPCVVVQFCNWCPDPTTPDPRSHPNGQPEHKDGSDTRAYL